MASTYRRLSFGLMLTAFIIGACSALQIKIDPNLYTEDSPGSAYVSCSLDAKDGDVLELYLIEIIKNGEHPMVIMRQSGISFGAGYTDSSKFQADGLIAADIGKSYLELTINDPNKTDGGEYSCKAYYSDVAGLLKEHTSSRNFTIQKLDISNVVRDLLDKVASLEKKIEGQSPAKDCNVSDLTQKFLDHLEAFGSVTNQLTSKTDSLENKTNILENRTDLLEYKSESLDIKSDALENVTQIRQIQTEMQKVYQQFAHFKNQTTIELDGLSDRVSYVAAFSAAIIGYRKMSPNTDIVFDQVIMRRGDGYNETTGTFISPRDGLYVFHLDMTTLHSIEFAETVIYIVANGVNVARLSVELNSEGENDDQSSVSTVVVLTKGSTVKARTSSGTMRWDNDLSCVFTGYLIKAY